MYKYLDIYTGVYTCAFASIKKQNLIYSIAYGTYDKNNFSKSPTERIFNIRYSLHILRKLISTFLMVDQKENRGGCSLKVKNISTRTKKRLPVISKEQSN